ncbi:hypothetical protein [Micrococcus luteus]|uniref:hypothetical protein n=1 Tax=Micrococcus luteus TaxID=1270 RepID=UPI0037FFABCC
MLWVCLALILGGTVLGFLAALFTPTVKMTEVEKGIISMDDGRAESRAGQWLNDHAPILTATGLVSTSLGGLLSLFLA